MAIVQAVFGRREQRLHPHRQPDLRRLRGIDAGEARCGDAHDFHRLLVDEHLLADEAGSAAEAIDPVAMADDDDRMAAIDAVVGRVEKTRPAAGPKPERLEVVAGDQLRAHGLARR